MILLCKRLGSIPRTKLNKLLFYADFLNFKHSSVSLTGTAYRAIQYGPVPASFDHLCARMERADQIRIEERDYGGGNVGLAVLADPNAAAVECPLTYTEIAVVDFVVEQFRHTTAKAISEQSHQGSAYRNTEEKQLISYGKAQDWSLSVPR